MTCWIVYSNGVRYDFGHDMQAAVRYFAGIASAAQAAGAEIRPLATSENEPAFEVVEKGAVVYRALVCQEAGHA